MHSKGKAIKIFTGNANVELAQKICGELGIPLGDATVGQFSDGEISVNIGETVRGRDVFVIQSVAPPQVNRNLMELLIMIDALKRASAGRVTAVIPYYGYARQDRKAKARDPISAKLLADIITKAGADRVLTMDLHAAQIQGYFNIPLDHLYGGPLLSEYFSAMKEGKDYVVVSPDLGSVTRTRDFAERIDAHIAIIEKRRPKANVAEVMNVIGDIEGKDAILVDDLIDTAGTITKAADAILKLGARKVYACCTHPVLSGPAYERIQESAIEELIVLDTIKLDETKKCDKIKQISVAKIFAEAIRRIFNNDSISILFDE